MLLRLAAALLSLLPWLRAVGAIPPVLAALVDRAFFPLCHHLEGRVLLIHGEAMCVCSRCAGLYAGLATGFLLATPRLEDGAYRRLLTAGLVAIALDVVTQDTGLHAPFHPVRLATGALVGWAAAAWMVVAISRSRRSPPQPQRG